jgi:hypothetical protein
MGTEGPHDNVLKMRPPMIFSRKDADHLMGVLEDTFAAVEAGALDRDGCAPRCTVVKIR